MRRKRQGIFFLFCGCAMVLLALAAKVTAPSFVQVVGCTCENCTAVEECVDGCTASCCQSTSVSLEEYYKIDLNNATKEQLCMLYGIGEAKAKLIIEYRVMVAEFDTVEDVTKVTGITQAMLEQWGDQVYVSPKE